MEQNYSEQIYLMQKQIKLMCETINIARKSSEHAHDHIAEITKKLEKCQTDINALLRITAIHGKELNKLKEKYENNIRNS